MQKFIPAILVLLLATVAVIFWSQRETSDQLENLSISRTLMQQAGTYYQPVQLDRKPTLTEIKHAWFPGANSI